MLPAWRGYDTATMVLAFAVSMLTMVILLWLSVASYDLLNPQNWLTMTVLVLLQLFRQSLYLLMGAVMVLAILSWTNPYNGLRPVLELLTRPYLQLFRKAQLGGVDLSPLVLFLVIQVILMLPLQVLENFFLTQLKTAI